VSIVLVTKNGMATLPDVFDAIGRQRTGFAIEIIAVDSESTDGTTELLSGRADVCVPVPAREFDHGATRNLAVGRARGEFVVLLVQDAVPASDTWLESLVAPLAADPTLAGTFARQVPRPDASRVARHNLANWAAGGDRASTSEVSSPEAFDALAPAERHRRAAFDHVCAAIRRSVWCAHPYQRAPIAEDLAWAREVLLAGHRLAFVTDAVVVHSHDRPLAYEFQRTRAVHARLFDLFGMRTIPTWPALVRAIAVTLGLHARLEAAAPRHLPRALALAVVWPLAQYLGGRDAARRHTDKDAAGVAACASS
jgi:rhamnosyltransferase